MLKAQGCEGNIFEMSLQQKIPYPEDMPKEARVKDACPATCNVCSGTVYLFAVNESTIHRSCASL